MSGWRWRPVEQALAPRAAVARGAVAASLLERLSRQLASERESLQMVAAPGWLVVLGTADALPWVDGIRYAAPSPQAPSLWLPTHAEPDLAHDLVDRALRRHHGRQPLLLWPDPTVALPLDAPQAASDAVLQRCSAARP
ncbi:bpX5 domain-containing protein [Roseateles sp. P5_E4]